MLEFAISTRGASLCVRKMPTGLPDCTHKVSSASSARSDETMRSKLSQSRVLIANSNIVPHWATLDKFNELDRKGLMMYGQMTAGSWIYIGSQGIVQGTYETFA